AVNDTHAPASELLNHAIVSDGLSSKIFRIGLGGACRTCLHLALKAVAAPRHGFDVNRIVGGISERLPQPKNRSVDPVADLDNRIVRPQTLADLFPQNHFARMLE